MELWFGQTCCLAGIRCLKQETGEWFVLFFVFLLIGFLVTVSLVAVVVVGETGRRRARRRKPGPVHSNSKKGQSEKRRKRKPKSREETDTQSNQSTADVTMPPVSAQPDRGPDPYAHPPEANLDVTVPVANNTPQQPSI
ncbi:hypothetical protein AAVH_12411 [Aphelenchoides avenae]|nr:hypothetical protein AAVH_12411 [Aphelenchus avenae]